MSLETQLMAVAGGAASGAVYAVAGYVRSRTKKEPFVPVQFFVALIWGFIVGAVAAWRGWDYYQAADVVALAFIWTQSLGLNLSIDTLAKIAVREVDARLKPKDGRAMWDAVVRVLGVWPRAPPTIPPPPEETSP